jgi:AcrR family transcriptional regulator
MSGNKKLNRILDRTAQFLVEGSPFNMSDLARDLNISRKTLYNYFKNRSHLLQCTIDYFFEQMGSELEEKFDRDLPFLERGELILKQLADRIDRIERLCSQKVLLNSQVEIQYKRVYASIKKRVEIFIKEGQTLGWIRSELSPVNVADLYFSIIIGSLHYNESHESYGTYLVMVIQGLMSDGARKKTPTVLNEIGRPRLPGKDS